MNVKDFLINKDKSIFDALKQLDKIAKRILFVVDDNNFFIGSLTDGDIRRYILKTGKLEGKVEEVCNKKALKCVINENKKQIIEQAQKLNIKYIPVVSLNNEIIEIIVLEETSLESKIAIFRPTDIPVVIMAGGFGTRMEPFTKILPKPLIPIKDKTMLEIIMEKFHQYGVSEFWISVNYKAYIIKSYLSELNLPYKIFYIQEDKPLGTAGSLYMLKDKIKSSTFILTNCDVLADFDIYQLLEHHQTNNYVITIIAAAQKFTIPYGVCKLENEEFHHIEEKPSLNYLVNTGIYLLNTKVLEIVPEKEFFNATDLIHKAKNLSMKIGIFPISEDAWLDVGQWDEYKKAIKKFL